MTLILEHLAGAYRPLSPESVTPPYNWYKAALTLSRFPNTYIKFGGLGEFCVRPRLLAAQFGFEEVPPLMDLAYEAFGPRRMMWGSDYPRWEAEKVTGTLYKEFWNCLFSRTRRKKTGPLVEWRWKPSS
jgi:predicted TIM-barrel fold metal-dependent hydrolase